MKYNSQEWGKSLLLTINHFYVRLFFTTTRYISPIHSILHSIWVLHNTWAYVWSASGCIRSSLSYVRSVHLGSIYFSGGGKVFNPLRSNTLPRLVHLGSVYFSGEGKVFDLWDRTPYLRSGKGNVCEREGMSPTYFSFIGSHILFLNRLTNWP